MMTPVRKSAPSIVGAIALAAAALLAVQAAFGAPSGRPRIVVDDLSPLTVVGAGFPARQAVVVTVQGNGLQLRKTVSSTAAGSFSARWNRSAPASRCGSMLAVKAV